MMPKTLNGSSLYVFDDEAIWGALSDTRRTTKSKPNAARTTRRRKRKRRRRNQWKCYADKLLEREMGLAVKDYVVGQYEASSERCVQIIMDQGFHARAFQVLGLGYKELGLGEGAVLFLYIAYLHGEEYEPLCEAACQFGYWKLALDVYEKEGFDDVNKLGVVAEKAGSLKKALEYYDRAGDVLSMGALLLKLGRVDEFPCFALEYVLYPIGKQLEKPIVTLTRRNLEICFGLALLYFDVVLIPACEFKRAYELGLRIRRFAKTGKCGIKAAWKGICARHQISLPFELNCKIALCGVCCNQEPCEQEREILLELSHKCVIFLNDYASLAMDCVHTLVSYGDVELALEILERLPSPDRSLLRFCYAKSVSRVTNSMKKGLDFRNSHQGKDNPEKSQTTWHHELEAHRKSPRLLADLCLRVGHKKIAFGLFKSLRDWKWTIQLGLELKEYDRLASYLWKDILDKPMVQGLGDLYVHTVELFSEILPHVSDKELLDHIDYIARTHGSQNHSLILLVGPLSNPIPSDSLNPYINLLRAVFTTNDKKKKHQAALRYFNDPALNPIEASYNTALLLQDSSYHRKAVEIDGEILVHKRPAAFALLRDEPCRAQQRILKAYLTI